ncbi:MAG: serine hydrolase domain-containing protein [Pseudomonadota bacterium]
MNSAGRFALLKVLTTRLLPRAANLVAGLGLAALVAGLVQAQEHKEAFRAVTEENFDSGGAISRQFHLHPTAYRFHEPIYRSSKTRALPVALSRELAELPIQYSKGNTSLFNYVRTDPLLDAAIVVHRGEILFETYSNMQDWERHFSWSVSKIFAASVIAALAERGQLNLATPIDQLVPELKDSGWAGIPLQNVLDMASGIDCLDSDGYQNQDTCIYQMEESLGITAQTDRDLSFLPTLQRMQMHREANRKNEYVSANTNVLMLVAEAVANQPYPELVRGLLWSKIGAEADAFITVSPEGYSYASGGVSLRLRDLARFGQVFAQADDLDVLSSATVAAMQTGGLPLDEEDLRWLAEELGEDLPVRAAWQWDQVWADGAMFKSGYSGQGLYVDPSRELVIAWFGTGQNFGEESNEMLSVARQIARAKLMDMK